ncbi:MAG: T9SS type A sorting domain-containing protein, partial [Salibacteraceae bacterium]
NGKLKVYPNPAHSGFLTIASPMESAELSIRAIDGRLIYTTRIQSTNARVDLSEIASGSYILELNDGKGSTIQTKVQVIR